MTMLKNFNCDDWSAATTDLSVFEDILRTMTHNSVWEAGVASNMLQTRALMGTIEKESLVRDLGISELTAQDTCENSRLMLLFNGKEECLRNCAFSGLLDTARIRGGCFRDMPVEATSDVINTALKYARGSSLLLHRGEKITAIMSDASNGYRIMEQDKLVDILLDGIKKNGMGNPLFTGGFVDHEFTEATFELPDAQKALNQIYQDAIKNGRKVDVMPAIQFRTSDVRNSAATIAPVYRFGSRAGGYFTLASPLKVDHRRSGGRNKDGLDAFEDMTARIYARFKDTEETIEAMSKVWIHYPLNAFILMTQKVGLPKKYAKEGYEDLERYTGGTSCSMYDVYMSIVLANETAKKAGLQGLALSNVEDSVAAVLSLNWTDYDIPGVVAWNTAA